MKQIAEFKKLWSRDRGGKIKGDPDGRLKLMAIAELAYVHFEAYYKSPYKKYSALDRMTRLVRDLALPETWKPDTCVQAAIAKYYELEDTPATGMLEEVNLALNSTKDVLKLLRTRIDGRVAVIKASTTGVEHQDLNPLLLDLDNVIVMAGKVPKMIVEFKRLSAEVEVEQAAINRRKGNVDVEVWQTPERNNRR